MVIHHAIALMYIINYSKCYDKDKEGDTSSGYCSQKGLEASEYISMTGEGLLDPLPSCHPSPLQICPSPNEVGVHSFFLSPDINFPCYGTVMISMVKNSKQYWAIFLWACVVKRLSYFLGGGMGWDTSLRLTFQCQDPNSSWRTFTLRKLNSIGTGLS